MVKADKNLPRYKFAKLIKSEREKKGLGSNDIEKACGVSRGYQWMLEAGKRNMPGIVTIMKLEMGMGLKCGYLVSKAVNMLKKDVYNK